MSEKDNQTGSIELVKVEHVIPDENQPRKYFNAEKIKTLKNSLERYGMKQPLIVHEIGKNKYLISDGERRYRAASLLKWKTVPVIVEAPKSETERLVEQFNIQEQHEGWTQTEKASAIGKLASQMGLDLWATCKLLNVTESDSRRYVAFSTLIDKETWVKSEMPIDYAGAILSLRNSVKRISKNVLEKEFTRADEKKLEHRIIDLVKTGGIVKRSELTQLKDAFEKAPKSIDTFLSTKVTPTSLFLSTKAKGTYHLRNVYRNSAYVVQHWKEFQKTRDAVITGEHVRVAKDAIEALKQLINSAE